VSRSRTILIAGAGIGGLVLALALVAKGFRATILEQAERLDDSGAGIQLSPNATRILIDLGLGSALASIAFAPDAIRVLAGSTANELVRLPLGQAAELRYGVPYWVAHRGDLHGALLHAVRSSPDVGLQLGTRVEDFAIHSGGVTVHAWTRSRPVEEQGIALVGADGVWSKVRARLGDAEGPRFGQRTAWRALVPASAVSEKQRQPVTSLWLGANAHLVHYPIRAGEWINIVAIVEDAWQQVGWNQPGARSEIISRFAGWAPAAQALLATPTDAWSKWALYDHAPLRSWTRGPITLLGDAAHPMLPFLAQGGAMAIEDAAVLARCLAKMPEDPAAALRGYEGLRRSRTARVVRHARCLGKIYHLSGPAAMIRNLALIAAGGQELLASYDWLYDWRMR
jgi:2-polyprenyl-6-methoxyphenol hydroxylase-like FAD-dependent oxidoreductase